MTCFSSVLGYGLSRFQAWGTKLKKNIDIDIRHFIIFGRLLFSLIGWKSIKESEKPWSWKKAEKSGKKLKWPWLLIIDY